MWCALAAGSAGEPPLPLWGTAGAGVGNRRSGGGELLWLKTVGHHRCWPGCGNNVTDEGCGWHTTHPDGGRVPPFPLPEVPGWGSTSTPRGVLLTAAPSHCPSAHGGGTARLGRVGGGGIERGGAGGPVELGDEEDAGEWGAAGGDTGPEDAREASGAPRKYGGGAIYFRYSLGGFIPCGPEGP